MRSAVIRTVFGVALVCVGLVPGAVRGDINQGLVAHWTLDEESGTIAHDRVGSYDGTLMGNPQWIAGKVFGGIQLDGTDDYVELPIGSLIGSLTNSSFATWVNFTNTGGAWQRVFDFGSNTTYNMFLCPRIDTAGIMRFTITITSYNAEQQANATATLPTGWHHVAVTIDADNDTITLYLDGAVAGQNPAATLTPSDLGNTTQNWFGRSQYAADAYFSGSLDDFRIYNRALSQEEVVELMNWVGGANAGPDQSVTTGDRVTLSGQGPAGSTFSWAQTGGQEDFEAVLQPSANQAEVWFDTPSRDVGFLLTFELTVTHPTEGTNVDSVKVYVYAPNAPKVAPGNLRAQPTDKGFWLLWDPVFDAAEYTVLWEVAPGVWFDFATIPGTEYEFKGLKLGTPVIIKVRADNTHGQGAEAGPVTYIPMRNLAVTQANGGSWPPSASFDYDGDPVPGLNDGAHDDDNDSQGTSAETEDSWGYMWPQPLYFNRIAYIAGTIAYNGGWWTGLTVQYTEDGTSWVTIPNVQVTPAYDFTDAPAGRGDFSRYDIEFITVRGTGIRLYGEPGGMDTFTAVAELEVFGDQTQGPLVVQGLDAVFSERGTAILDGSYSFSTEGPVSGYTWVQLSGPPVTIQNANAAVASFDAPAVDEDALYVFQLTATGSGTESDADVRIIVKNLETAAVAGADQIVGEGILVTLNGSGSVTTSGNISYAWTQLSGPPVTLANADKAVCTFTSPAIWSFIKQLRFRLQVTDGVGGNSTDEVNVNVTNPVFDIRPLGTGYWRDLLHLGQTPADRFTAPLDLDLTTNDYLDKWGGQANVNPVAGEAYDFSDTGITTTVNPMVWTPEHEDNGFFAWDGRASGAFDAFGQIYHIYILSPEPRDARVRYRHDDEMRLFNNGALARGSDGWDNGTEAWGNITLSEGVNSMLLRVEEGDGGNDIAARITDRNDIPYTDLCYALSIPNPLPNAYAVRDLPGSYEAGTVLGVTLSVRANPDSLPPSIDLRETIPPGLTVANAGGGQILGQTIYWNLTGQAVGIHTISYSLNVPGGTTGGLDFAGTLAYAGGPFSQGVSGENVVYEVPSAPTSLDVEMMIAAHLSWRPSLQEGISGYRVYSDVDGAGWQEIAFVTGASYIDDWIEAGKWYRYRVAAVNSGGVEGAVSSPSDQKTQVMEIREAEDFNYGGGLYPWQSGVTTPAVEATAQDDLAAAKDFWHPNKGGPRTYRPLDAVGIWTATEVEPATGRVNMGVGWIYPGSWWRYNFDVPAPGPDDPPGGWVKLVLRIATLPNQPSSVTAYWDETVVGTAFLDVGTPHSFHYLAMDEFQTTPGTHTLRVEAGGDTAALDVFDFDKIGIGFNWSPPRRETIWQDDFESYASGDEVFVAGNWTKVTPTPPSGEGEWRLWDTGQDPTDIGGVEGQYMISDSDWSGAGVLLDEQLISPEVDCAGWTKLRLNFNKSYRIYDDPDHAQTAEVDVRSFDPASGWSNWTNLLHLDTTSVPAGVDPPELNNPEVFDLSAYDGKKVQIRFHFFNAEYDYWFAVDNVRVSGEQPPQEVLPPDIRLIDGGLMISWQDFGSGQYSVEYATDLKGTWTQIAGPFTQTSFTEAMRADKAGYYRIVGQ